MGRAKFSPTIVGDYQLRKRESRSRDHPQIEGQGGNVHSTLKKVGIVL